ncbi:unnamed protein product, partial [Rotaria sordida]
MSATKHRGLYAKEKVINAVRAVKDGKMTSVEASKFYKVPSSTIRCHVNGYSARIGAGASFYLSKKQEDYLVELIKSFESIGLRLTKLVLKKIVGQFIKLVTNNSRFK